MTLKVSVKTSEDIAFEGVLVFAPASNYSDGQVKGFRPAIRWAMVRLPSTIIRSGMFNIKELDKEDTTANAIAAARALLFEGDCICGDIVDNILEEYAAET